jgi:methylase of polypeptide subunit release factors
MLQRAGDDAAQALGELLAELDKAGYAFVPPTPATHARVLARPGKREASDLRDVFGWNLPFAPGLLPPPILDALERSGSLRGDGRLHKSAVRVARLGGRLFLHSAFPTTDEDAVFFGPDSYRFVDFVARALPQRNVTRLVDLGAGSGAGGISAGAMLPGVAVVLLDANARALAKAAVNARHAGVAVELVEGESLDAVTGPIDLVIANPPYMMDDRDRTYRDGGGMHGARVSLDWALAAARRLEPGGTMLLYTGSAIVSGRDELKAALEQELPALGCALDYREIDPDVFGEDLCKPAYAEVERIAVVGAVIEKG